MSDAVYVEASCSICDHSYNSEAKRPLMLPCSHSFCQDCLQKLEALSDKLCPVCRKSWSDVNISDLPTCYQLIPSENKTVKKKVERDAGVAEPPHVDCEEHGENYIFWCTSCDVPSCKRCWKLKHEGCGFLFIEDKCEALEKECLESVSLLKEAKGSQISLYLSNNKTHVEHVKDLIEKLQVLETELIMYQARLQAWEVKTESILSADVPKVTSMQGFIEMRQQTSKHLALCQELQARPSTLLLQIACCYNESSGNASEFISSLKKNLDTVQNSDSSDAQAATKTDPVLQEGGVWVISDSASANAVFELMLTTSLRPSRLKVTWTCKPEQQLVRVLHSKMKLEVDFILDCFIKFDRTCQEFRNLCAHLILASSRCFVAQFWGHFDAIFLGRLPTTIQSVGLVLREDEDMGPLRAFQGVVFQQHFAFGRHRLLWPCLTELNLSVSNTFQPQSWRLNSWQWSNEKGEHNPVSFSTALSSLRVRLRLFLNQLVPRDICWIGDILRAMRVSFSNPVPLFLPGARIDPDPLLGVLRDSGQCWEVHFPASMMPERTPREKVAELYEKYGHSVTWDLQ